MYWRRKVMNQCKCSYDVARCQVCFLTPVQIRCLKFEYTKGSASHFIKNAVSTVSMYSHSLLLWCNNETGHLSSSACCSAIRRLSSACFDLSCCWSATWHHHYHHHYYHCHHHYHYHHNHHYPDLCRGEVDPPPALAGPAPAPAPVHHAAARGDGEGVHLVLVRARHPVTPATGG